jgi:hypothetical protein
MRHEKLWDVIGKDRFNTEAAEGRHRDPGDRESYSVTSARNLFLCVLCVKFFSLD